VKLDQIKELMASVEKSKIKKLSLKEGNFEITIEKEESAPGVWAQNSLPKSAAMADLETPVFHPEHRVHRAVKHPEGGAEGKFITSPMVGTFYAAPAPDQPVFVKVGDAVNENTVVCIIEAMKVMNEVKANMKGTIAEVLVESAQPVEFGSKIFRIV
jgi:acetyl-CoA carboxylase biotin carboxyl carrier protein